MHLVAFVHSQSYRPMRVHLVPNYHLSRDPLELPQGPLWVPGPHFENQWNTRQDTVVENHRARAHALLCHSSLPSKLCVDVHKVAEKTAMGVCMYGKEGKGKGIVVELWGS